MVRFLRSLYLSTRLFWLLGGLVLGFVVGFFVPWVTALAKGGVLALAAASLVDAWMLWRSGGIRARREAPDRFSNGDENPVDLVLANDYGFPVRLDVIDEVPVQFQVRDERFGLALGAGEERRFRYTLRPTERGEYHFGAVLAYAAGPIGLLLRRFRAEADQQVQVYPSFIQMRRYAFLATSNRLEEVGVKRVRRLGRTMEFDQIREYVAGDDPRTINWQATARRGGLHVNQYQDERSQPVYAVIDMGRTMEAPFEGMTLLDYAINASLVLLNTALLKNDRAGLVTFGSSVETVVRAERRPAHIYRILEALYNQETTFREPNFEALYATTRQHVHGRGLLLLFTNFETRAGLERQLPYLRALARSHLVVVVFFENTGLHELRTAPAKTTEDLYVKTVAEKLDWEKREIVRELNRHGVQALLTTPDALTVDTINRYLEVKARGLL
ncbi:MAG: DUF58 domain-containing protein [Rhodothermales bacterium]